jgi:plasmid stabilization system protein ParE
MDFRLPYSKKALADLESILDEIAADDPEAASRFGSSLLDHIDLLKRFPQMGAAVTDRARVRKLTHTPIVAYYVVHLDRRTVEVLHLRHGARLEPQRL